MTACSAPPSPFPLVARQFLAASLPPEFLALVDWEPLEVRRVMGIDESLAKRREDVIYSIRAAETEVCLYVLIEHQSQPDSLMLLRIAEYTILLWRENRRKTPCSVRPLPLVVPVVLNQGTAKWTGCRQLADLIDIPG